MTGWKHPSTIRCSSLQTLSHSRLAILAGRNEGVDVTDDGLREQELKNKKAGTKVNSKYSHKGLVSVLHMCELLI